MVELTGEPQAVPDEFASLAALLGLNGQGLRVTEAVIQAQTSGVTVRFGDQNEPPSTAGGTKLSAGDGIGLGPVQDLKRAWPLDRIWVRETTASGGAEVSILGVAEAG